MHRLRRVPGRPLVVLAHVEQEHAGRQVRRHHFGHGDGLVHLSVTPHAGWRRPPVAGRGRYCTQRETPGQAVVSATERILGRPGG